MTGHMRRYWRTSSPRLPNTSFEFRALTTDTVRRGVANSAPGSVRLPRPRVHPRTTSRSPSTAQSMAISNANAGGKPNEYAGTTRTSSCARKAPTQQHAAGRCYYCAQNLRSSTTTTTSTTPASVPATMGFRDPLIVRRERARTTPI